MARYDMRKIAGSKNYFLNGRRYTARGGERPKRRSPVRCEQAPRQGCTRSSTDGTASSRTSVFTTTSGEWRHFWTALLATRRHLNCLGCARDCRRSLSRGQRAEKRQAAIPRKIESFTHAAKLCSSTRESFLITAPLGTALRLIPERPIRPESWF